jgi:hypothetical protein
MRSSLPTWRTSRAPPNPKPILAGPARPGVLDPTDSRTALPCPAQAANGPDTVGPGGRRVPHDPAPLGFALLDARLNRIRQARPLPPETVRSLGDALRVRATWASNAIEGNSLTLQETKVVLDGLTVGGKPLGDHLEAVDHAEAWDAMIAWASGADPSTPFLLRSLHALV